MSVLLHMVLEVKLVMEISFVIDLSRRYIDVVQ